MQAQGWIVNSVPSYYAENSLDFATIRGKDTQIFASFSPSCSGPIRTRALINYPLESIAFAWLGVFSGLSTDSQSSTDSRGIEREKDIHAKGRVYLRMREICLVWYLALCEKSQRLFLPLVWVASASGRSSMYENAWMRVSESFNDEYSALEG